MAEQNDDDSRLVIELFDANGVCVKRGVGPSQQERKAAHDACECDQWCAYCYTDACASLVEGGSSVCH